MHWVGLLTPTPLPASLCHSHGGRHRADVHAAAGHRAGDPGELFLLYICSSALLFLLPCSMLCCPRRAHACPPRSRRPPPTPAAPAAPRQVTIVPREKHPLGQTVVKANEHRELTGLFTRRYLEQQLLTLLAGRAGALAGGRGPRGRLRGGWPRGQGLSQILEQVRAGQPWYQPSIVLLPNPDPSSLLLPHSSLALRSRGADLWP